MKKIAALLFIFALLIPAASMAKPDGHFNGDGRGHIVDRNDFHHENARHHENDRHHEKAKPEPVKYIAIDYEYLGTKNQTWTCEGTLIRHDYRKYLIPKFTFGVQRPNKLKMYYIDAAAPTSSGSWQNHDFEILAGGKKIRIFGNLENILLDVYATENQFTLYKDEDNKVTCYR